MPMIPRCHKFRPTNQEVIEFFLTRRAMNQSLIDSYQIVERSLYGEQSPWDVFSADDPWEICKDSNQKVIHCFSKVISKGGRNMSRIVRTSGIGTWDGKAVSTKITGSDGKLIGHKRAFTFKAKKGSEMEGKGKWIMHEFSLAEPCNYIDQDCVFCRITVHYTTKAGNVSDEDDSGASHDQLRRRKCGKTTRGLTSKSKSLDQDKIQELAGEITQGSSPVNLGAAVDKEALNNPAEAVAVSCELSLAPPGPYPPARLQLRPPAGLQLRPADGPYTPAGLQLRPEQSQVHENVKLYQRPWRSVLRSPVTYNDSMINASQNLQVVSDSVAQASSSSGTDRLSPH